MNLNSLAQSGLFQTPILTVGEITRFIRDLLQDNETLQDIWVSGEVTNFSSPVSGHIYFSLKDDAGLLRCVIWKPASYKLKHLLADGKAVEVHGSIRLYEQGGSYQLTVDNVRLTGEGLLFQEFIRLKTLLEAEGLFAEEKKKPIPAIPNTIGIVTSSTGAALQDILNVLRRRFPLAEIILAPTSVQGDQAPFEIISALNALIRKIHPDVILVARGGGSLEDLWAFNDEHVVRAIASSPIPVIAGIGHETDFTLADFAADVRAPTPTAAAEIATPDINELRRGFLEMAERLRYTIQAGINHERQRLDFQFKLLMKESPQYRIENLRQSLDFSFISLNRSLLSIASNKRNQLAQVRDRMEALNPLAVLRRGYAIVTDKEGVNVTNANQVSKNDILNITLDKSRIQAEVKDTFQEE